MIDSSLELVSSPTIVKKPKKSFMSRMVHGCSKSFMKAFYRLMTCVTGLEDEEMPVAVVQQMYEAKPLEFVNLLQDESALICAVKISDEEKQDYADRHEKTMMKRLLKGSCIGLYYAMVKPFHINHSDMDMFYLMNRTYFSRLIIDADIGEPCIDLRYHRSLPMLEGFVCENAQWIRIWSMTQSWSDEILFLR